MVASLAGPAAGTPRALRRPCQGRPGPGDPASLDPHDPRGAARAPRVLRSRGLTVVAAPADTDYTIRLETPAPGWRTADRGGQELTGRDIVTCLAHSPGHRAGRAGARLEYAMSLGCHQE